MRLAALVLACCCLLPADLCAAQFGGSLRSLGQLAASSPSLTERSALGVATLRLTLNAEVGSWGEGEAALENQLFHTQPRGLASYSGEMLSRRFDLSASRGEEDHFGGQLQVDRLSLRGRAGALRWTVGRQPYGFGGILLFSPLDIIAPFAPTAIDTEYRPGIDALRADFETSAGDQLGLLAAFGSDTAEDSYLATGHFNRAGLDLLLLGGSLRERGLAGLGLAGSLGGLGVKGEVAWYRGKQVGQADGDLHEDFPIAALEFWYRFQNGLVLLAEYLHNGAGSAAPAHYPQSATSATAREGISPLLGQNYLLLSPSYELHPLISLSARYIRNLDDRSWLLRPQVAISLGDNLSLDISHSINRGADPAAGAWPGLTVPRSEFGLYGDSAALYLRYYF